MEARQAYFRDSSQDGRSQLSKKSNSNPPEEAINRFRGNLFLLNKPLLYSRDKDATTITDWGIGEKR